MANPPPSPGFDWVMFRYVPSLVLAILCLVLFFLMAFAHFLAFLRYRHRIMVFVIIGALLEVGGFSGRIASHYDNSAWAPFIIQGVLLLIGPLFFAATIYMMLGRTIRLAGGEDVSLIPVKWYTRIFVTADITTLVIQGTGASIMGTMQLSLAIAGQKVVLAGLAIQVATFVMFLTAAIDFQIRMNKKAKQAPPSTEAAPNNEWKRLLNILYGVSSLILLRCIFRLVEYGMGNGGYPTAHEWMLYTFDALPMFAVLVVLLVLRPTQYLPAEKEMEIDSSECELSSL